MHTTSSEIHKILCNINSQNVLEQLRLFAEECDAQKINYEEDTHPLDAAYICGKEILLIKCDMLAEKERDTPWLSDEQDCQEDPPLFYSESSHRISPIYTTEKEKEVFEHIFPTEDFKVYILLLCNYQIINYEDMKEVWTGNGIFVVDKINQTEMESVKRSFTPRQNKEEEYLRLLNEFIAACEEENGPIEEQEEEEEGLSEEDMYADLPPKDLFDIETIRLHGVYKNRKHSRKAFKTLSCKNLISVCPNLEIRYLPDKMPRGSFSFRMFDETGMMILSDQIQPTYIYDKGKNNYKCMVQFSIVPENTARWHKGTYLVEILFQEASLHIFSFSIADQSTEGDIFINKRIARKKEEQAIIELERMIGLQAVKKQIDTLRSNILMAERRQKIGLKTPMPILHATFCGSPGTGKTTIAKLYGKMLKELGILESGHVVFEKRSTLLGRYYSSPHKKTLAAIEKAKGGILFIDEAYLLYKPNDPKDPGADVLESLLTEIDHNNNEWVLVMAGYTEEMNAMLSVNPGLSSRIPMSNRLIFEDYSIDELMSIADKYCDENNYFLSTEARIALRNKIETDYRRKDSTFGNGRYVISLLTNNVLQAMSLRLRREKNPSFIQLMRIEKEDIPEINLKENPFEKLNSMIGLKKLKMELEKHLNMVRMMKMRSKLGILSQMPPLHMAFLGNPGTGKTTVADLIGEIYASLGILSIGHVISVERRDLVGTYGGETEHNVSEILKKAKGNVLFIDEAYTLYNESNGIGQIALESLLTTLSKDSLDMIIILAGYTDEMEKMLSSNKGLRSRIPYTFYFEDYSVDELLEIGKMVAKNNRFRFTASALKALRTVIEKNMKACSNEWGNARFITRLITNEIIPKMSSRIQQLPLEKKNDIKALTTIRKSDIPVYEESDTSYRQTVYFDEESIRSALNTLNRMVGLEDIKENIHDFIQVAKTLKQSGKSYAECFSLRWNFTGNTGTGKSTIAGIMGKLLKAMGILENEEITEVKYEEFYNASEYKIDSILKAAILKSKGGVLFIDGDASIFKKDESRFNSKELLYKISSMIAEIPGNHAIILAENEHSKDIITQNLNSNGVRNFNHTFYFKDYSEEQLLQILKLELEKHNLYLSEKASEKMYQYIKGVCTRRELGYANARTMKQIADSIAETFYAKPHHNSNQIEYSDVELFKWHDFTTKKRIGFITSEEP